LKPQTVCPSHREGEGKGRYNGLERKAASRDIYYREREGEVRVRK